MSYKVMLTGTQCTGKSTLINILEKEGYQTIRSVSRNSQDVGINHQRTLEGQKEIFRRFAESVKDKENYISDRCMLDAIAYTYELAYFTPSRDVDHEVSRMIGEFKEYISKNNVIICYIPIEFPLKSDGVRSTDDKFRKRINNIIKHILDNHKIPYITLSGNVNDRIDKIKEICQYSAQQSPK